MLRSRRGSVLRCSPGCVTATLKLFRGCPHCAAAAVATPTDGTSPAKTIASETVPWYSEILILNLFAGPLSLFKGHYDPRRDGMRLAPHAPHHCFQRWSW